MKRTNKTKQEQIIKYWETNSHEFNLSIDFSEANKRCWRCGYKSKLEKCHIIPHSLGGSDEPHNYILLCSLCHAEGPNVEDEQIFWDWLKAHKVDYYDTYWIIRGINEYKFIYGKTIDEEIVELEIDVDTFNKLNQENFSKASWHFGQPRMNPATIAGILRITILQLRKLS